MLPLCDWNVVDPKTTRYRRTHNTPVRETEKQLNDLYGGWKTILCNSGMEAINTAFDLIHPKTVIVDDETYFETRHYLAYEGQCKLVQLLDLNDLGELERALARAALPAVICGDNPTTFGNWKDVEAISHLAHRYGAYVMMDNSIVSLYYESPLRQGADICVESYTKYVCGHGDVFAGGIVLSPSMKWMETEPTLKPVIPGIGFISWVVSRRGNVVSPYTGYMVSRGLETLGVRMERHTASATMIYEALKRHDVPVQYSGKGGLITLPGRAEAFCRRLKRFVTAGTFGCTYSNADFFRTDSQYAAGVCARLSVGLEDPEMLWEDVAQALEIPRGRI